MTPKGTPVHRRARHPRVVLPFRVSPGARASGRGPPGPAATTGAPATPSGTRGDKHMERFHYVRLDALRARPRGARDWVSSL